jgi:glutaredoxin
MGKRIYHLNSIRYWYSYDIDEAASLLEVHVQTIRKWVKDSLPINSTTGITLIYGNDLKEFLGNLNKAQKCPTNFDQMLCLHCKDAKDMLEKQISIKYTDKILKTQSACIKCKKPMYRNYELDDLPKLRRIFNVVDVSQLYDSENPSLNTHFSNQAENNKNEPDNEPLQGSLFE